MSSRFQRVRPSIVAQKGISGDFELSLLDVGAKRQQRALDYDSDALHAR